MTGSTMEPYLLLISLPGIEYGTEKAAKITELRTIGEGLNLFGIPGTGYDVSVEDKVQLGGVDAILAVEGSARDVTTFLDRAGASGAKVEAIWLQTATEIGQAVGQWRGGSGT